MKIIILLISSFFIFSETSASIDSLWNNYNTSSNPDKIAFEILNHYATDRLFHQRDSAMKIFLAKANGKNVMQISELYKTYFSSSDYSNKKFTIANAQNWVELVEGQKNYKHSYLAYHHLSRVLFYFGANEKACNAAEKEYLYAGLTGNKIFRIEALFNKAKCFEMENNKSEAFKSYLDAYYFSLEIKNKALIKQSLQHISNFFVSNKLYSKAKKYKKQEFEFYVHNTKPCDSNLYYSLLSELSDNYFDNNELNEANNYSNQVLGFCIRKGNRELLIKQLSIIRSNYFENNNFDGLLDLYKTRFPSELDSLKKNNGVAYYRIRSLIFEQGSNPEMAAAYLDSAEIQLQNRSRDALMTSNFYNRKGEFYLRQKKPAKAVESLLQSLQISSSEHYFPFLKSIAQNLNVAYVQLGDYQKAHLYQGLTIAYSDSLKQMIDNDEIVLLEVENLEKQKELFLAQQEEQTARKHNLQYMLIVILIASSFIVLIVLGSIKIPSIVIRSLGYFVFIFFFEFIILLADHKIHHMTHGAPLQIMGLKIILIGILLPIHHWVEHKVVHYLLHYQILQKFKIGTWFKTKFFSVSKSKTLVDPLPVEENKEE